MKKILITCFALATLVACNSGGSGDDPKKDPIKKDTAKAEVKEENNLSADPVYQKGLALVAKSDCLTCHKIDEALTGPSYRDIANKYAGASDAVVADLAGKIIKGGQGVWSPVPMTAHASISEDDAKAMVKYILLLKK